MGEKLNVCLWWFTASRLNQLVHLLVYLLVCENGIPPVHRKQQLTTTIGWLSIHIFFHGHPVLKYLWITAIWYLHFALSRNPRVISTNIILHKIVISTHIILHAETELRMPAKKIFLDANIMLPWMWMCVWVMYQICHLHSS